MNGKVIFFLVVAITAMFNALITWNDYGFYGALGWFITSGFMFLAASDNRSEL
jgi:hypothetical protein